MVCPPGHEHWRGATADTFLNQNPPDLASQHRIVYVDAASDTHADAGPLAYGGRVVTAGIGPGCLFCLDHLDQRQIRQATITDEERAADAAIYGVPGNALDATGPSVVTVNGVVASLAATEAMIHLTGLRTPKTQLTYRADHGSVRINLDTHPAARCAHTAHDGRTTEPCSRTPVEEQGSERIGALPQVGISGQSRPRLLGSVVQRQLQPGYLCETSPQRAVAGRLRCDFADL